MSSVTTAHEKKQMLSLRDLMDGALSLCSCLTCGDENDWVAVRGVRRGLVAVMMKRPWRD
jgi:hypothetical protein